MATRSSLRVIEPVLFLSTEEKMLRKSAVDTLVGVVAE